MKRKQRLLLIRCSYLPGRPGIYVVPPLGILMLAGVLREKRSKEVEFRILDMGIERMPISGVARIIREYEPDAVGISALSIEANNVHSLARTAKKIDPEIKVFVGGPHASCMYEDVLKDTNVDYAVVGEGEATILELLDSIRDGSDPLNMPGVALRLRDGEVHYGGDRASIQDLDSLPLPAWDMINIRSYSKRISMNLFTARTPYATMFTSRACPYRCIYCHTIFGKKFRAQSPERVLEEMEYLSRKMGVKELQFYDDVFNFKKSRVMEIMEGVLLRGIDMKFAFPNGVRGDLMSRDLVQAMVQAGTYSMTFAAETASPRLQKLIKKNLDLDKTFQAIEWTFEEGAIPCGFFMLGFPTETREEMEQTIEYACNSKMLKASFWTVVPFQYTELYRWARETYPDYNFVDEFSSDRHYWAERSYYSEVSGIDVEALLRKTWIRFYMNPWRIWNILKRFPKNRSFIAGIYDSAFRGFLGFGHQDEKFDLDGIIKTE